MKILALEFSSEQRSVAFCEVANGVPTVLGRATEKGGRSTRVVALVESVLAEAKREKQEVECVAIGIGPGSYTGIRAAIALAQGWQIATNVRTLGISSVECMAAQAQASGFVGRVNIVVDAQRGEFYLASYEISPRQLMETEKLKLVSVEEVKKRLHSGETVIGPEAGALGGQEFFPDGAMLARLTTSREDFISADRLEPIYLREVNFVKAPPPRIV